jgi:D-alanyl-D-alanine carboxypeptidase
MTPYSLPFLLLLTLSQLCFAQDRKLAALRKTVDSLCVYGNFPGLNVAIAVNSDSVIEFSSGFANKEEQRPLTQNDRMLAGSVGKTYVAAIAMLLIREGKLSLSDLLSKHLQKGFSWYPRLPNADSITIKMLLNHTSGVMRYEFKEEFTEQLSQMPQKRWRPAELISFVLDEPPPFAAGKGWEYSDTNYILLGMVIEKVTKKKYYELLREQILKPYGLHSTHPSDRRKLQGLAQGYAGFENPFGKSDRVIKDGLFIINPQFEWTGGGVYSTSSDLAKWASILWGGKLLRQSELDTMTNGVPAKLGQNSEYGLGVIIRESPFGKTYGHSGFFPGYLTDIIYFPKLDISIALQVNTSDVKNLKFGLYKSAMAIMKEWVKK